MISPSPESLILRLDTNVGGPGMQGNGQGRVKKILARWTVSGQMVSMRTPGVRADTWYPGGRFDPL
jgi:hypothetical protein